MKLCHEKFLIESEISKGFCQSNQEYQKKWDQFLNKKSYHISLQSIEASQLPGIKEFLSDEALKDLYKGFIILIAECLITFEQALLLTKRLQENSAFGPGLKKFHREELIHSWTFKKFLKDCKELDWYNKQLMIGKKSVIRKALFFWVKKFPESLYLVGAKSEIFSLCYARQIEKILPQEDDWRHLNKMHLIDEAHHIPFAIKMHNEFHQHHSFSVALSSYITFFLVQFLNLSCSFNLIKQLFPKAHRIRQSYLTFLLSRWILREFDAYQETRQILKRNFKKFNVSKTYRSMAR